MTTGTIRAIAIKPGKGEPMREVDEATVLVGSGLEGNARSKDHRSVTLVSAESWQRACDDLGDDVSWTLRRANILVDGIDFNATDGAMVRIGDVALEITQETKPCGLMDEQHQGLLKALIPEWRGGACSVVTTGGTIRVGDTVTLEPAKEKPMSVQMTIEYKGGLRTEATHGPSGTKVVTDAPVDNHGKGESFSPTDLTSTALASCMMTIIGIVAERDGVDTTGLSATVEKHMVSEPVRRIGKLVVSFTMPAGLDADARKKFERAALTCPVHKSLHPDVEIVTGFVYPDEAAAG